MLPSFVSMTKPRSPRSTRKDPLLPLSPGRAERHGFEYIRHLDDVERSRWEETEVQHLGPLFGGFFPAPSTVARGVRD